MCYYKFALFVIEEQSHVWLPCSSMLSGHFSFHKGTTLWDWLHAFKLRCQSSLQCSYIAKNAQGGSFKFSGTVMDLRVFFALQILEVQNHILL